MDIEGRLSDTTVGAGITADVTGCMLVPTRDTRTWSTYVRLSVVWPHADDVSTANETPSVFVDNLFSMQVDVVSPNSQTPIPHWLLTPCYIDFLIALSD